MVDKREKAHSFDDFFDDDQIQNITDMIEQIIDRLEINMDDLSNEPLVYGFSVTHRSGGNPGVREFGSIPGDEGICSTGDGNLRVDERVPLIDVVEIEDSVHITAEIPGMEKEDISLNATDSSVELYATHNTRQYSEVIDLPVKVDPDSGKATYRNDVLEVVFKIVESPKKSSILIE
ncbi:MAG: archaeal heat shock protein Hsp20 [Euryarchaeota archaeon]|nr:archaeal heat shock protein Hsp20 [Euryarchaeota archaeon]